MKKHLLIVLILSVALSFGEEIVCAQTSQPAPKDPDLIISSIDTTGLYSHCQILEISGTISARVENIGESASASAFFVVFFEDEDTDGVFDPNTDNVLGEVMQGALAIGDSAIVSSSVDNAVAFQGNLIYAFVDSRHQILESDETNNYYHTGLPCESNEPKPGSFSPKVEWAWTSSKVHPDHLNVMMTPGIMDNKLLLQSYLAAQKACPARLRSGQALSEAEWAGNINREHYTLQGSKFPRVRS